MGYGYPNAHRRLPACQRCDNVSNCYGSWGTMHPAMIIVAKEMGFEAWTIPASACELHPMERIMMKNKPKNLTEFWERVEARMDKKQKEKCTTCKGTGRPPA